MMTSSNGNIFCVTGPLCGEFTGPGEFPAQRPVTRSFGVFFDLRNNREAGDLRRYRSHYDVIVMIVPRSFDPKTRNRVVFQNIGHWEIKYSKMVDLLTRL